MLQEKLSNPDYNGEWTGNLPGKFEMYILRTGPFFIPCTVAPAVIDDVSTEIESIEGVISDDIGISVFSGAAHSLLFRALIS